MNICNKWINVLVIKLTMHMRYGIFLMIKLLISRHVFLSGGGSSRPSSLFFISVFICWCWHGYQKQVFIYSFVHKNVRCLFTLSGRKVHNHSIHISNPLRYVMLLLTVDLQQSMTPLFTHLRTGDVICDVVPLTCVRISKNIVKTVNSCCALTHWGTGKRA